MKTRNRTNQGGFALILVLFLMAAISTLLAMLVFSSSQRAFTATRLTSKIKAQAMAEAGCELGYAILSTDWESRYDASAFSSSDGESQLSSVKASGSTIQSTTSQPATYELDVEPVGSFAAIVTSTGTCGSVEAVSVISVQNLVDNAPPDPILDAAAFGYAILCGGEFDFSGCGTIASPEGQALFHSNGKMFLRGSVSALINLSSSTSIKINNGVTAGGDVTAEDLDYKSGKVTFGGVASETAVDPVEIPDIDLTAYYNWALEHGEVHNGFTTTTDINPNGGILWVEGDVHISAHAVVNGSIIATGDINMSGDIDINPTTCAFGLVSRDGDIQVTSSGIINGLIYAKSGGLDHTANGEIVGQIIVNGDIKKAGNSDIMAGYQQSLPSPPNALPITDYIAISAWQR